MNIPLDDESHNSFLPARSIVAGQSAPSADHDATIIWHSKPQVWLVHDPPSGQLEGVFDLHVSPPAYESFNSQEKIISITDAQTAREAFASPSGYIGPSLRRGLHPYYSCSDSFDCPPPVTTPATLPSRSLLSFIGRKICSSRQAQMSAAPSLPPLPPSFSRPYPPNLPYNDFPPIYLIANGKHLDAGFPVLPPPSPIRPHPFASHDVNEADWSSFLGDLRRTATLSRHKQADASCPTLRIATRFLEAGIMPSNRNKETAKNNKCESVSELIDIWNRYFFNRRQLEVILARGVIRLDSGAGSVPQIGQVAPCLGRTSSESSSQYSSIDKGKGKVGSGHDELFRLFVVCL